MPILSVTDIDDVGALDLVSTTARNRRIFAWHETDLDLRVLSKVRRPPGRDEFSASCDKQVGRRWPRIPSDAKIAIELALFLCRAGRSVMPAARVIVTDFSQVASDAAAARVGGDLPGHVGRCVWWTSSSMSREPSTTPCTGQGPERIRCRGPGSLPSTRRRSSTPTRQSVRPT